MRDGWRRACAAIIMVSLALGVASLLVSFGAGAASAQTASAPVMPGETLAFDRSKGNCLTCHEIQGGDAPGNVGPQLSDMKKRYSDRNELAGIIFDETKRNPSTVMPPFGRNLILTPHEIDLVIDFLYTR